ncbi:MAG: lipoyl(octanoyl) transferase LipB [Bacteroidales bacterium]|nr:lipoyl(octanoyl) transferase LipB [Bacteroidales bacterium]
MQNINFIDWSEIRYAEALERQTEIFNRKVKEKIEGSSSVSQDFILCEHNNVYTIGKHGKESNMLVSGEFLKKIDAEVFKINRGGDITYHGRGQITGYPSLDLDALNLGIRDYIFLLEEMVIKTMSEYQISCSRLEGATGVWIDAHTKKARKICAIGVKVSRGITMHGFALNVNTDLTYFNYINPCGFVDKGVTSMAKELIGEVNIQEVKQRLYKNFSELINKNIK